MVRDGNHRLQDYVWITRHVAVYIIQNLRQIIGDANNEDETGFIDQMNPELPQYMWMQAVIRYISTLAAILEHNSEQGVANLLANVIEENEQED